MRGGRVRVAPDALQRLLQEQALPARREEERIDGGDQESDAERLVAAIAQAHIHADGISACGGLEGLGEIAKHEQARGVDRGACLGDPQLHGGELGHAAVAAGHRTAAPEPLFPRNDPNRWAVERQYLRNDAAQALAAFRRWRNESLELFSALPDDAWDRGGVHSDSRGRRTLDEFVTVMAWHDENHLDQLRRALEGRA